MQQAECLIVIMPAIRKVFSTGVAVYTDAADGVIVSDRDMILGLVCK